jgi:membrane protease YdiL (CAAX protease family)
VLKLLLKALVIPLLGGPAVNAHFHFISGNTGQLISMIGASIIVAGFGEEIVYRGFLFNRLWRAFGESKAATMAIVVLTTVLFASIHIPEQGIYGGVQAAFTGLTFATIYALTRSLWLPIVMHAAFDVTAVLIIYFDVEQQVARSILG